MIVLAFACARAPTTCPADMAAVRKGADLAWCVDRWEGSHEGARGLGDQKRREGDGTTTGKALSREGVQPSTRVSWYQAVALCRNAGKHLCTVGEWRDACDGAVGAGGNVYPWGATPDPSEVCAAPKANGWRAMATTSRTGAFPKCAGEAGIYDLIGNAWEWVDPRQERSDGLPMTAKVGAGFYSGRDKARCDAHAEYGHLPSFDGSISFRCCATPEEARALGG